MSTKVVVSFSKSLSLLSMFLDGARLSASAIIKSFPGTWEIVYLNFHRGVRKKPKLYNTTRGGTHLLAFFLSGRVKLIVTSERLNIYQFFFDQSKAKSFIFKVTFTFVNVSRRCAA
jgi:hypothetical protein